MIKGNKGNQVYEIPPADVDLDAIPRCFCGA